MQVKKEVGQHHDHAITTVYRRRVAEDALPDLRVSNNFAERWHANNRLN
jgi:hypothetical protein